MFKMESVSNRSDVTLADVCTPRAESVEPGKVTGLPYVGLEHLDTGQPRLRRHGSPIEVRSTKSRFYEGDILYGKLRPYLDKAVRADHDGICSTDILVFAPKPTILPSFLIYLIHTPAFVEYAIKTTKGVNHPRTSWHSLAAFKFRLPPIVEQQAIAEALDAVQKAKEVRQHELTLERERKAALMEHLFSHGTRSDPTKQTDEIGEIPETWEFRRLGSLARIGNGSTPNRAEERYWNKGTIPWITSTKVHEVVITRADEFVSDAARRECHLPLVPKGSIVVAITGQGKTLGNAAILDIETCINQHLAYITLEDASVHPLFALFYLQSRYRYLRDVSMGGGSTKGALTCGFLKRLSIPVPPIDQQSMIAGLLLACETICSRLQDEIALLEELFRAVLDELMTGELSALPPIEEHQTL